MKWKLGLYRGLWGLGFPKIKGTILGVPIIRTIVFWSLCRGPLILGKYRLGLKEAWGYIGVNGKENGNYDM